MTRSKKEKKKINNEIDSLLKSSGKLEKTERFFNEHDNYKQKYLWLIEYESIFSSENHPSLQELKKLRKVIQSYKDENRLDTITTLYISGISDLSLKPNTPKFDFLLGELTNPALPAENYEFQFEKCIAHLDALIESYWKRSEIIKIVHGKGSTPIRDSKKERVFEYSQSFVDNLSKGRFTSNKAIIKALKDIEPAYRPSGDKEKKLLKTDGSPFEKRICISLATIFEIKYDGETVHWTTIRDAYKDIGLNIAEMG